MDGMNANQIAVLRRKEWCRALGKIPHAYVTSSEIMALLNVCKTKAIEVLKAAGGIKIGRVWRVDKADLIEYLVSLETDNHAR